MVNYAAMWQSIEVAWKISGANDKKAAEAA
jgi:hypothetical protein